MVRKAPLSLIILTILILLPVALAQDVVIFGHRFSFLLIAPIIMMAIFLAIFILIVLRDILKERYGSIKEVIGLKREINPDLAVEKTNPQLEILEEETEPAIDYISEIDKLKKGVRLLSAQEAYRRLIKLIRTFFSELLQIDYKFTFDELEKELNKKHKNIIFFSKNLSEMCYTSEEIPKQKLLDVLNEFDNVVKAILADEEILEKPLLEPELLQEKHKQGIGNTGEIKSGRELKKELKRRENERRRYEKELLRKKSLLEKEENIQKRIEGLKTKEEEIEKKATAIPEQDRSEIISLINNGEQIIEKDIKKATEIYKEACNLYSSLPEDDKKALYPKLARMYDKIRLTLNKKQYKK